MSHMKNRRHNKNKNKHQQNKNHSDNKKEAKSKLQTKSTSSSSSSTAWPTSFIALTILTLIAYNKLQFNLPSITGTVSSKKPYQDIDAFYPYYLKEHSSPQCQRMHIIGSTIILLISLLSPECFISAMIGLLSG
eukprot:215678_1